MMTATTELALEALTLMTPARQRLELIDLVEMVADTETTIDDARAHCLARGLVAQRDLDEEVEDDDIGTEDDDLDDDDDEIDEVEDDDLDLDGDDDFDDDEEVEDDDDDDLDDDDEEDEDDDETDDL